MTDLINGPRCHEAARAIADLPSATPTLPTVAATWRANGEPDPHGNRYDCERAALPKGSLTDDELANAVFMADRNSLDLIVWQTAAKERIRWLSRALAASQSPDLVTNAGSRQPTLDEALALPEIAALVEAAQWARNRLDIIADESWHGDGRDLKRSVIGVFADFDDALAAVGSTSQLSALTPADARKVGGGE